MQISELPSHLKPELLMKDAEADEMIQRTGGKCVCCKFAQFIHNL
jgi:hypothetical protein